MSLRWLSVTPSPHPSSGITPPSLTAAILWQFVHCAVSTSWGGCLSPIYTELPESMIISSPAPVLLKQQRRFSANICWINKWTKQVKLIFHVLAPFPISSCPFSAFLPSSSPALISLPMSIPYLSPYLSILFQPSLTRPTLIKGFGNFVRLIMSTLTCLFVLICWVDKIFGHNNKSLVVGF